MIEVVSLKYLVINMSYISLMVTTKEIPIEDIQWHYKTINEIQRDSKRGKEGQKSCKTKRKMNKVAIVLSY